MSIPIYLYQPTDALEKFHSAHPNVPHISVEAIQEAFHKRMERKRKRARILALAGLTLWLGAFLAFALLILPELVTKLFPGYTEKIARALGQTVEVDRSGFGDTIYEDLAPEPTYIPPYDPDLPEGNWLIIDKIGINTPIGEGEDWEEVLRQGVWRAYQFSDPEDRTEPTILAAHRFGYIYWTNQYRRQNSFYNLPKLENGDQIEVIWNQRRYVYEVFEGYTDTKLKHLDADLILFTCEVLNSDRRVVRKARLLIPDKDMEVLSQSQ